MNAPFNILGYELPFLEQQTDLKSRPEYLDSMCYPRPRVLGNPTRKPLPLDDEHVKQANVFTGLVPHHHVPGHDGPRPAAGGRTRSSSST